MARIDYNRTRIESARVFAAADALHASAILPREPENYYPAPAVLRATGTKQD